MTQIRPWLYIGKYRDTTNPALLESLQIGAMLQFAELVEQPVEAGRTILVACGAGISRSAAFTIAALREIEQISLKEAYFEVKRLHPDTFPHPAVWKSLCRYFKDDTSFVPYLGK